MRYASDRRSPKRRSTARSSASASIVARHAPARAFSEPAEGLVECVANEHLDRIETSVRAVLAAGGEMPLRNRLARLLPN